MAKKEKFLPERMSNALRGLALRGIGGVMVLVGLWLVLVLMLHNPYLSGFSAAGNFGDQSVIGNIVGFLRYCIGWVPSLFLFLCLIRAGIFYLVNWEPVHAPEYNLLRGFIAVCVGAVGLGAIVPASTFGGLLGSVAAYDLSSLFGGFTVPPKTNTTSKLRLYCRALL